MKLSEAKNRVGSRRSRGSNQPSSSSEFKSSGSGFNIDRPIEVFAKVSNLNLGVIRGKSSNDIRGIRTNSKRSFESRKFLIKGSHSPSSIQGPKVLDSREGFKDLIIRIVS